MARVVPYLTSLPRVGNEVSVVVGEPLDLGHITCRRARGWHPRVTPPPARQWRLAGQRCTAGLPARRCPSTRASAPPLLHRCNQAGVDQQEVWRDIAAALRDALLQLEKRAPPNPNQVGSGWPGTPRGRDRLHCAVAWALHAPATSCRLPRRARVVARVPSAACCRPPRPQLEERPELRGIIEARCRRGAGDPAASGSGDPGGSVTSCDSASMGAASSYLVGISSSGSSGGSGASSSSDGSSEAGGLLEGGATGSHASGAGRLSGALQAAAVALAQPCAGYNSFCHALAVPHWAPDQERRQTTFARLLEKQPWRTVHVDALGAPAGTQQPAGAAHAVPSPGTPSRWRRLLLWRLEQRTAQAQGTPGQAGAPPSSRRVWWSWRRALPQREPQPVGMQGAAARHGWQGAPA